MSIIDSFYSNAKPKIDLDKVCIKSNTCLKSCIINFSNRIMEALIQDELIVKLDEEIKSISAHYPVYLFKGSHIGIVKTTVGAPITTAIMEEISYIYSCKKFVMFGSCGGLDKSISLNSIIVPTDAYRDEGVSYHYMPPSDYISIKNHNIVSKILDEMNILYNKGKTWTTDAFYRETDEELEKRKNEGCISVEMEISACQAVANYRGLDLYAFLYRDDNLDSNAYDKSKASMMCKDKRLSILNIAYKIAVSISE